MTSTEQHEHSPPAGPDDDATPHIAPVDLGRFFRDSPVLACSASSDGYLTQLGGPWTETLGWSIDELTSQKFFNFVHPDDLPQTAMEVERLNAGLPTVGFVNRYCTSDGGWRHIQWHARRGADGEILAIAWDITADVHRSELLDQRTLVLETLKEFQTAAIANDLHDLPLDLLVDGIRRATGCTEVLLGTVETTADQAVEIDVLVATPALLAATGPVPAGPSPDAVVGPTAVARITNLNTITAAAVRTGATVVTADALADPHSTGDPDAEPAVTTVLGLPLRGSAGLVGTLVLAERPGGFDDEVITLLEPLCSAVSSVLAQLGARRASERMGQLMNRLSTLFTAVVHELDTMLVVTSLDGSVRFMNPAAEELLGVATESVAGRCRIGDFVRTTEIDGASEPYATWMTRPDRDRREWNLTATGGRAVPVLMSVSALRDEHGTVEGWVHLGTNLTERKRMEDQQVRSQALESEIDDLRNRERELGLLREATEYVMSSRSTRDALAVIGSFTPQILGTDDVTVHPTATGDGRPGAQPRPDAVGEPVGARSCWALRTGRTHVTSADQATRCGHLPAEGSFVCVPLGDGERPVAVLTAATVDDPTDVRRTTARLEDVARQMGVALANLGLRRSLERQTVADPLTGVGNRRAAAVALDDAHHACRQRGEPFALVMVDLDHFKGINDRLGHEVGDRVLQEVAGALTRAVREGDTVARMGGEEFLVVLRNISAAAADRVAESLRVRIEGSVSAGTSRCTASAGLVHVSDADADPDTLVGRADEALYDAKRAGRNRVCRVPEHAEPSGPTGADGSTRTTESDASTDAPEGALHP